MGYLGKSATFVWHVSVSSVKRSRHRFAASRWQPVLTPGTQVETRDANWGAILADIPQIPGPLSAIFRLIEAHRNKIQAGAGGACSRAMCDKISPGNAGSKGRPKEASPQNPSARRLRLGQNRKKCQSTRTCRKAITTLLFCLATN